MFTQRNNPYCDLLSLQMYTIILIVQRMKTNHNLAKQLPEWLMSLQIFVVQRMKLNHNKSPYICK